MTALATTTCGGLPAVRITSADGAQALVTLFGAHLVSWKSADGTERLFLSEQSALDGSKAIRGGVPVIFPQFAERGPGMRHGFARLSTWRLVGGEQPGIAVFALNQDDLAPAIAREWPYRFELQLTVSIEGARLSLALDVYNSGREAFAFSSALHTYFLVDDIDDVRIGGLHEGVLRIGGKHDRIYHGVGGAMTLAQDRGALVLTQLGFPDAVVWNPGAEDTAALSDMARDDYRRFVCIEPALIEPATLRPGASWRGEHQVGSS